MLRFNTRFYMPLTMSALFATVREPIQNIHFLTPTKVLSKYTQ